MLTGLQVSMKLLDLVCFGHSNIQLRLSIIQAIDIWALVLCSELNLLSNDTFYDRFWTMSYFTNFGGVARATVFSVLVTSFNENKNKKACSTDVMVALFCTGL